MPANAAGQGAQADLKNASTPTANDAADKQTTETNAERGMPATAGKLHAESTSTDN